MTAPAEKPVRISAIADIANGMIEQAFISQVMRAAQSAPMPAITLSDGPILEHLNTQKGEAALREQLNKDVSVVVALVGIPSSSSYEGDIHQLLATWSTSKKPVLLIASCDKRATARAINSWQGWEHLARRLNQPVETLKQAIVVNEDYIVAGGGEKALAEIQKSITVAQSLKAVLSPPQSPAPSISVQLPKIEGMPELSPLLNA